MEKELLELAGRRRFKLDVIDRVIMIMIMIMVLTYYRLYISPISDRFYV